MLPAISPAERDESLSIEDASELLSAWSSKSSSSSNSGECEVLT